MNRVHGQVSDIVRGPHRHLPHVVSTLHGVPHCAHGQVANSMGRVHGHVAHPVRSVHCPVQRSHRHVTHRAHRLHRHVSDLVGDDVWPGEHAQQVVAAGVCRRVGGCAEPWVRVGALGGARAGGAGAALSVHRPPHNVPRCPVVADVQARIEPPLLELGHPATQLRRLRPD